MQINHAKSITIADATGTVTFWNGTTTGTAAATDLQRPSDWNSGHNLLFTFAGNTVNASTVSGTNVPIRGLGQLSVGGSDGSIILSCAPPVLSGYNEFKEAPLVAGQVGQGSVHLQRWNFPDLSHDRIVMPVLFSGATNSTGSMTATFHVGLYTRNGATLSLVQSSSWSTAITHSGTANSTLNSGMRMVSFGWSTSRSEGMYHVAALSITTSGGANMTLSQMVNSQINSNFSGYLGSVTSASLQLSLGHGVWSTTTTQLPNSINVSDVRATASAQLRSPAIFFINGTV